MESTCSFLLSEADKIRIIDTHEHLNPHKDYLGDEPDILSDYFSHYITSNIKAAGMSDDDIQRARDHKINITERFKLLEPYLEYVKSTSYYRSLAISAAKLYDIPEISISTIEKANEIFKKRVNSGNYRDYILKDLCNIRAVINDCWSDDMKASTTDLFTPAWHPDNYINPAVKPESATLDEYCETYKRHFFKQIEDGMRTLKSTCAYWRTIYFENTDYNTASELYKKAMQNGDKVTFPKQLQDYLMHYVLKLADENNFIIQIHTGLQEGMLNDIENSNPMLLKNLFAQYPNLTFDLFHIGYPYNKQIIILAKYHPNVYIDMCCAHIITPYSSREFLDEALDVLPYNKIFGFGGDYLFLDGVLGHLAIAKQNICVVLANKVDRNEISLELSQKILQAILHDNAARVFKI